MIILSQRDDVALGSDFKAATAADFDVRAFELGEQGAVALEDGHVEAVAVRVADQDVPRVRNVDPVGKIGDVLAADTT